MNNDRRTYRVNGKDVVVDAQNVNYDGIDNIYDVASALDNIDGRLAEVEENGGGSGGGGSTPSYAGKKIAVIGDSFSSPNQWQATMCQLIGATLIGAGGQAVGAVDGTCYGGSNSAKWAYTRAQEVYAYCSNNGVSPDYILVCVCTNDIPNMRSESRKIGTFMFGATVSDIGDSLSIDSIISGMQATILYLKDKFPNAKIIISPTPGGVIHSGNDVTLGAYNFALASLQVFGAMREVCTLYGLEPPLDCYYCIGPGTSQANGNHPSGSSSGDNNGQEVIGKYMAVLMQARKE